VARHTATHYKHAFYRNTLRFTVTGRSGILARRKVLLSCLAGAALLTNACAMQTAPPARAAVAVPAMMPPVLRPIEPALTPVPLPMMAMAPALPAMLPPPTDAVSLRERYGAPDFIRREPDSELWRYDGANCAAFFFLYREGNLLKLRYTETMPRGMDMAADPVCVESLSGRAAS
jgi:hypothetical protein